MLPKSFRDWVLLCEVSMRHTLNRLNSLIFSFKEKDIPHKEFVHAIGHHEAIEDRLQPSLRCTARVRQSLPMVSSCKVGSLCSKDMG